MNQNERERALGAHARAGANGAVLALVDPSQAKEVGKIHDAAEVSSVSHHVEPGHRAVRELAGSGIPIAMVKIPPRRCR